MRARRVALLTHQEMRSPQLTCSKRDALSRCTAAKGLRAGAAGTPAAWNKALLVQQQPSEAAILARLDSLASGLTAAQSAIAADVDRLAARVDGDHATLASLTASQQASAGI